MHWVKRGSAWKPILVAVSMLLICGVRFAQAQQTPPGKTSRESAQNTTQANQPPQLQADETSFDFGEVKEGEVIRHDFVVKNLGTGELQITRVNPG